MCLLYFHFFPVSYCSKGFKEPCFEIFMRTKVVIMKIVTKPLINS